jgi:hypothetical protein
VKFAANADTELYVHSFLQFNIKGDQRLTGRHRIIRMSSWRGRTTISGEWNARDYDENTIKGILDDVVNIMLSICG